MKREALKNSAAIQIPVDFFTLESEILNYCQLFVNTQLSGLRSHHNIVLKYHQKQD